MTDAILSQNLSLRELNALLDDVQKGSPDGPTDELECSFTSQQLAILLEQVSIQTQLELLCSLDGTEYMTVDYCKEQLLSLLRTHGRLSISEISQMLDLPELQVKRVMQRFPPASPPAFHFDPPDQLLGVDWARSVLDEIRQCLEDRGILQLDALCARFELSHPFLRGLLADHARADPAFCHLDPAADALTNDKHLRRVRLLLSGRALALLRPTRAAEIVAHCGLPFQQAYPLLEEAVLSGPLSPFGHLVGRGEGALYEPHSFRSQRDRWVLSRFSADHAVPFRALDGLCVQHPPSYLRQLLSPLDDALLFLPSMVVGSLVLGQLEAFLADPDLLAAPLSSAAPMLPPACTADDARLLLAHAFAALSPQPPLLLLGASWLLPRASLARLAAALRPRVTRRLWQRLATAPSPHLGHQSIVHTASPAAPMRSSGELSRNPGSRKGKLRKRDKRRVADSQSPLPAGPEEGPPEPALSPEEVRAHVLQEHPGLEQGLADELQALLAPELRREEQAIWARLQAGLERRGDVARQFETAYLNARLFWKHAQGFGAELPVLADYLVKTFCAQLLALMGDYQANEQDIDPDNTGPVADVSAFFERLQAPLKAGLPDEFFGVLDGEMPLHFLLKKPVLDRYAERSLLSQHLRNVLEQLRSAHDDPPRFHQLLLSFLLYKHFRVLLHAPGRLIPVMYARLKDVLAPSFLDTLQSFHQGVIGILTGKSDAKAIEATKQLTPILFDLAKKLHLKQDEFNQEDDDHDNDNDEAIIY